MKKLTIFLFIILLAFVTRFYRLDKFPPALNLDEVAMGYDAFSIVKTARDQYGQFLPIYFRSHDDYKPPFIIYSQAVSIAILGLSDFAVRMPSAIYGVLGVVFTFLLCKELFLFDDKRKKVAGVAALLLAISPWSLQFTRTAYEVGIQAFLSSFGLYLILLALRQKKVWGAFFSGVILGVSTHLYTASRVFIPLLIVGFVITYLRDFWRNKKILVVFTIGFMLLFGPTIYLFTTPAGQVRFKGTNIFSDPAAHNLNVSWQIQDWLRNDRWSAMIFHQENLAYVGEVLSGYFSHLRPDFIYLGATHPSTNYVPNTPLAYLWELPFLLIGFGFLFKRPDKKPAWFLLFWILLAPVPAAVTYGIPTSIRVAIILPALQIVTAFGFVTVFRRSWIFLVLPIVILSFAYYLHMYYIHAPIERSGFWYPGYRAMVAKTKELSTNYNQIIVSTSLDQPQSFFLYYLQYPPADYLSKWGGTVSGSYAEDRNHFEKYFFKPINWTTMKDLPGVLFVGRPQEMGSDARTIEKFYYLNGEIEAVIATPK